MWITSVSLPMKETTTQDPDGFPVTVIDWLEGVPASRKDTTRDDEILAKQAGYSADQTYELDKGCYSGQGYLKDEETGTVYDVKRSFIKEKSNVVALTCEVRDRGKI